MPPGSGLAEKIPSLNRKHKRISIKRHVDFYSKTSAVLLCTYQSIIALYYTWWEGQIMTKSALKLQQINGLRSWEFAVGRGGRTDLLLADESRCWRVLTLPPLFFNDILLHNYRKDNEINTSSSKSEMNYFLITVLQYHKPSSCTRPETRDRYDGM